MKVKIKKIVFRILIVIFLGLAIFTKAYISNSPSAQLLISVVGFSENTLKNPEYLAYNIDLMDLFQNYMNSDISYQCEAYITKTDSFRYSTSGSITGHRSFSQRKMAITSDMSVLWSDLGGLDLYAKDSTVYMIVPMLDDLAYAFDTEVDLFKKGPSLTSDISQEWFHDNFSNIVSFFQSITIDLTGKTYVDSDNVESYEYKMRIPQGQGQFIWDLLGMASPDYDIVCSMYLDKHYRCRRIEFDLSHSLEGARLIIDGSNCSTCILELQLPDNERSVMTIKRDANVKYTNAFITNITYYTNALKTYTIDYNITLDYIDNGMAASVTNLVISDGSKELLSGSMKGSITKENTLDDVFKDVTVDLDEIEVINWKVIRDDTETFINDIIAQAKKNLITAD